MSSLGLKEAVLGVALALAAPAVAEAVDPKETVEETVEEQRLVLQKALNVGEPDSSSDDKEPIPNGCETGKQEVPVLKVVDGDTIDVDCEGKKERIRIIGINTPETVHPSKPVECFGKEASNKMKGLLRDQKVIIKKGEGSGDRGKYGRLLRYVEFNGEDVGAKLIREGYAFSYRKYPHERLELYNELERQARESGAGLWAEDACADVY
ncbi:thermonuclease family protein [Candidatus Peregrinibacteria bacterium]|jgi:micrococcal nuclease|nr:thermonuclease family protein [Candidatus Peregrinibacteria bacterium]MBT4147945.1 thermonuclease family protein [Candidatus Peregrinibacteria bacterium]MBT4366529.1 thermonuclease family protein [Candidatus Peregrinibacteria bacterium]MBT4456165.1 thermonuclease family protein [Candidatus Peregrinibacteria bacterium]